MSEERRKRRQGREGNSVKSVKKELLYGIPLLLLACLFLLWRYYSSHKYDSFAKCLATHQVKMYGLYWCPHCADQKKMFGAAFRYVPYEECAIKDKPGELAPACKAAGVKLFPSWQFGNDPPKEGVFSLEEISDKTGCSLP
ncbi:MAG TPA: hypothetical protein VJQ54_22745 [Candidatus Sulfotelmatobacter sp.]|nr:hypothetical protein [Candidatus Sulfotelmatobacter sp.]